ncbi:ABC transporter permease [Micromonospora sp. NPDC049559]|uniref:ABC transporter permease n=1 Tax=Micromonospora sp. NPDC049559 TaxID=3155923 RepID=UPI00343F6AFC
MNRVLAVTRMQLVNWPVTLGWPWGILMASFLANLAIFWSIADTTDQPQSTGAVMSIYIVLLVGYGQVITQFFPFALGLGVTRRAFYAATLLLLVAESLLYGVLLYLCRLLEAATGGWGLSLRFFALPFLVDDNPVAQILIYAVPFTVLGAIGMCSALVFKRWGVNGLFVLGFATIVLGGGAIAWVSWQRHWAAIGHWFADQSALTLFAGWPVPLTLVLAGIGYLTIRRATA